MNHCFRAAMLLLIVSQSSAFAQTFTISSRAYSVQETEGTLDLQITRTGSLSTTGSVDVFLFPYGTAATPGVDYQSVGSVSFAPGQSTATAAIPIIDDNIGESDETFGVVLRRNNGYGVIGLESYGLVTIRDDEIPSSAPLATPPGPAPMLEGNILCYFGTPYDDDIFWNRVLTPELSSYPFYFPTAMDMDSPEFIVLGGRGDDRLTCCLDETKALPLHFDGEQGFNNQLVLKLDSVRDTNTLTICENELSMISERAAGTVRGVNYPASTWTATAENLQVFDVCVQTGGSFGDGEDAVFIKDTGGDDDLVIGPNGSRLVGTNYDVSTCGFDKTVVYGSTGNDVACFEGTAGDDEYTAKPSYSRLTGTRPNPFNNNLNNTDFVNYVAGFDKTVAKGRGGQDVAYISGSNQADDYVGTPAYGELNGPGYCLRANDFDDVVVFGGGGGDEGCLYDSAGDDIFVGRRSSSAIFDVNRTYSHTLKGNFDKVKGVSDAGGDDQAQLYDTHGSDTLIALPTLARLLTPKNFEACAEGFSEVLAISNSGGFDVVQQSTGLWYAFRKIGNWNY